MVHDMKILADWFWVAGPDPEREQRENSSVWMHVLKEEKGFRGCDQKRGNWVSGRPQITIRHCIQGACTGHLPCHSGVGEACLHCTLRGSCTFTYALLAVSIL